jgi:hypothetical protein
MHATVVVVSLSALTFPDVDDELELNGGRRRLQPDEMIQHQQRLDDVSLVLQVRQSLVQLCEYERVGVRVAARLTDLLELQRRGQLVVVRSGIADQILHQTEGATGR